MNDSITVLHVDDDADLAELTATYLEREDDRFGVETTTMPEKSLTRLDGDVDCIVSDYDMPGMDGIELLEAVREEYPDLPFILYTGKGSEEVASEAITKGATDYLQKEPGTTQYELLANRIRNAVAEAHLRNQLWRRKDQYEWLFEQAPVMFAMYHVAEGEPRLEEANDRFYEKLGYAPEELVGEPVRVIYTEEAASAAAEGGIDQAMSGEFGTAERTLVTADGKRLETLNRCVPRVDEYGNTTGLLTLYLDVTERRRNERESELFRVLVDHALDEMYVIDPDTGAFLAVNDAACRHLGYDREELLAKTVHDIDASGHTVAWESAEFSRRKTSGRVEGRHKRKDGSTYPVEVAPRHVELGDGEEYMFAVARDVSDRTDRERRLGELHDATRQLMDATSTAEAAKIAVETAEEILDLDINGFHAPGESGQEFVPRAVSDGARDLFSDLSTIPRDGSLAGQVYDTGEPVFTADVRDHPAVANPGTPVRSEIVLPVGDHGVFIAAATEPGVFNDADEDLALVLTSNLEHALDGVKREQQLRQRERELELENDRLEDVTSIISHDLRNPLNVIEGHLELARENCDCASEHDFETMSAALDRSFDIIEDVLTLTKQGGSIEETEVVGLATLADNCWRNVDTSEATIRIDGDVRFEADPDRFRHVLENLFRNAIDHGGDDVTIHVGNLEDGFFVADDGPGIPPEERDTVFEPGYTTRESGTGFGLHIVDRIVDVHGWEIGVTEAAEGGARFEITGIDVT
ncbi:MAG: PAS domain S-box protein [Halobacteriales archaeon]